MIVAARRFPMSSYTDPEAQILSEFHQALKIDTQVLDTLASTMITPDRVSGLNRESVIKPTGKNDPLLPVREWLDGLEIHDPRLARLLCRFIPSQCPFERDIILFGHKARAYPTLVSAQSPLRPNCRFALSRPVLSR
ncbi:MAG: hypothetical protein RLZZ135_901 [Cyanobacteriota bacterium]